MSRSHSGRRPRLPAVALPAVFVAAAVLATLTRQGEVDLRRVATLPSPGDSTPRVAATGSLALSAFWNRAATRLPGTLVAVIDTGVASTPDLAGRIEPGQSFVGGDPTSDENGHGTAVAGIVAGSTGVCRSCRILPLRVSAGAGGVASSENIAAAVDAAVARGAGIVNLSMVSTTPTDLEQAAVARAAAAGVLVVAAAGNAGSSTPSYPASYPGVLSVGATGDDGSIASFSNRGPWVSVLAPGCGRSHAPDGGEVLFCGTSAAAPYVAGVAAVLRSAVPTATGADVVAAIRRSSHPSEGSAYGTVDPAAALVAIGGVPPVSPGPAPSVAVSRVGVAAPRHGKHRNRPAAPRTTRRLVHRIAGRAARVPRAVAGAPN